MRRNLVFAVILVGAVPFGLMAHNDERLSPGSVQSGQAPPQDAPGQQTDQHKMPDMEMPNQQNVPSHGNQQLQEPENPGARTGSELPAPELLTEAHGDRP